jgi:EF-P beta-lysylation protein EpmB
MTKTWQQALSQGIATPQQLIKVLQLDKTYLAAAVAGHDLFAVRVPWSFVKRMQRGNPHDPLLRQVLPLAGEQQTLSGFVPDPLQEHKYSPLPGVLHKYSGRVLLVITGACAINCRYCFRRHFPYQDHHQNKAGWQKAIDYIAADTTIREVILSGGDPLVVNDKQLAFLLQALACIPHLTTVRIHTRLPIVLPARITAKLVALLQNTPLQCVVVVHSNHPNELNDEVAQALHLLHQAGITLLNQAVLLKGINDDVTVLKQLCQQLFAHHVLPYYLHLLDPIAGGAHFEVSEACAKTLMQSLSAQLPGYLVPRLVREIPGALHKTVISS